MVYFIRHTNCEANLNLVWHGSTESPVSSLGNEQLKYLSKFFEDIGIDIIYSSPLSRAYETALAVQKCKLSSLSKPRIILKQELTEFDGGEWEGVSNSDLVKRQDYGLFCSDIDSGYATGGESIPDLKLRVKKFTESKLKSDRNIVVVSHGVVIKAFNSLLQNTSMKEQPWIDNCGCTVYDQDLKLVKEPFCDFIPEKIRGFSKTKWNNK